MAKEDKKIPDYFGAYIGGANRDLWLSRGLQVDDMDQMTLAEVSKYACRDSVWPLPDAIKAVEGGANPFIVYWARRIRLTAYAKPRVSVNGDIRKTCSEYVEALHALKELTESVTSEDQFRQFYKDVQNIKNIRCCANTYKLHDTRYQMRRYRNACEEQNFPYNTRSSGKRKPQFLPPQLQKIEREGPDYRCGVDITPELWMEHLDFRGVEFGNWTSQKDRQASMNFAFDALFDLARAVGIRNTDVAFQGKLALAFGSRGRSHSSAHYEPEREVINLTKMHGAGCTAHEWWHALDDRLAKFFGVTDGLLASETSERDKLPESFLSLIDAMKKDSSGNQTDFYRGSKRFDGHYAKNGFGYWASNCEMSARAFSCYVKDVLDSKSDYLLAHADVYRFEYDDQEICAIPQGEEREILNEMFENLFFDLIDMGFFAERMEEDDQPINAASGVEVEKVFIGSTHSVGTFRPEAGVLPVEHAVAHDTQSYEGESVADGFPSIHYYEGDNGQIRFSMSF